MAMLQVLAPVSWEHRRPALSGGRVMADPLVADRSNPACDVSAMDGYAIRLDQPLPRTLAVVGQSMVGRSPPDLAAGTAVKIFTGSPIPPGANCVIPREKLIEHGDRVELPAGIEIKAGDHIRREGENCARDETVVGPGRAIDCAVAAALAAFAPPVIKVYRRVRVAVLVTGNEVRPPGAAVAAWQLRDSNGPAIAALLSPLPWLHWGGIEYTGDDPDAIATAIRNGLERADALIITGGVSAGDYDYVPQAIASAGGRTLFHKLRIRPGKPILGAVGPAGQALIALPGNPLAVLVGLRRFVLPALRRRAGFAEPDPPVAGVALSSGPASRLPVSWFRPVRLTHPGMAELVASRGSGDIVSAARSDGFVEVPPDACGPGPWPFFGWAAPC